jgi:hypothetical protein
VLFAVGSVFFREHFARKRHREEAMAKAGGAGTGALVVHGDGAALDVRAANADAALGTVGVAGAPVGTGGAESNEGPPV